jgi:tetratricopeptide (TPR) repeat protein/CHAT domain-containing protein
MQRPPLDNLADLLQTGRFRQALALAEELEDSMAEASAELRADHLEYFGRALRELGQYSRAEAPLLQALSQRASLVGREHPSYARTMHQLGMLYQEQGRYSAADKLLRSSLAILEKSPEQSLLLAKVQHDLAGSLEHQGIFREADVLYERSRSLRLATVGENHPDTGMSYTTQAWTGWRRGRVHLADQLARKGFEILRTTVGEEHPDFASAAQLLSRLELHQARTAEAERLGNLSLRVRSAVLGEKHHRYGGALENLALVRAVQGRGEEAEKLARRGVDITRAALGEKHPYVADGLAAVAYTQQSQRRNDDARKTYRQALDIYQSVHGDSPVVAACLIDLAELLVNRGEGEATSAHEEDPEALFRRAITLLENATKADGTQGASDGGLLQLIEARLGLARWLATHNRPEEAIASANACVERARLLSQEHGEPLLLASALDGLARVYHLQGRFRDAEPAWVEASECRRRALGEKHPLYAESMRCLAGLYLSRGQLDEAARYQQQSIDIVRAVMTENHPEYVQSLLGLAEITWQRGQFNEAEAIYQNAIDIERQRVGENHADHARVISHLARLYVMMNNPAAAQVRYRQVIEILEKVHGDHHPAYASALHDLGALYHQFGELDGAEALFQQARQIRQANPGEHSFEYAQSLHALAMLYQSRGQLVEAAPLFEQAVEIHSQLFPQDHLATLRLQHSQALFEQSRGDFRRAEDLLTHVRDRLLVTVGTGPLLTPVQIDLARLYGAMGDHLTAEPLWARLVELSQWTQDAPSDQRMAHAQDLINLAVCLRSLEEFDEAEALVARALPIIEEVRGVSHPDSAAIFGLLTLTRGAKLLTKGSAAGASGAEVEALFLPAVEKTKSVFGQAHPALSAILGEQAALCAGLGRFQEASSLYDRAMSILRGSNGEDHPDYLNLLRLQASIQQGLGEGKRAEELLRQRLTCLRRLVGHNNHALVPAMQQLADLLRLLGRLDEAETLCKNALDTLRRLLDDTIPNAPPEEDIEDEEGETQTDLASLGLAFAENNLAAIQLAASKFQEAESLLRNALTRLYPEHPAYPGTLYNHAAALAGSGRRDEALAAYEKLTSYDAAQVTQNLAAAGERNRALICHPYHDNYETLLSLAIEMFSDEQSRAKIGPEWRTKLLDLVLQRKRFGMDVLSVDPLARWRKKYPQLSDKLRRLWLLDRQIAAKRLTGGPEGQALHLELLEGWLEQREYLESQLADEVPELRVRRTLRQVTTGKVSSKLSGVLVEIAHYRSIDFRTHLKVDPAKIVPGVLMQDRAMQRVEAGAYVAFVLKAGQSVPEIVPLGMGKTLDPLIRAWREELQSAGASQGAGQALHAALWSPLEPLIGSAKNLVLALDGELLHLPIEALPIAEGVLADRHEIRLVISGRDLLRHPSAVGGFADSDERMLIAAEKAPALESKSQPTGWFSRLFGGTRKSEANVQKVSRACDWLGVEAIALAKAREQFVERGLPRIVHCETDVYFAPYRESTIVARMTSWENPLILSALTMGEERLDAREVTALDGRKTRVVVLARSETPYNDPGSWSRVSGLIGCWLHAGVGNVILSLWQVSEASKQLLLSAFYERYRAGHTPATALREAKRLLRTKQPGSTDWASWICVQMETE